MTPNRLRKYEATSLSDLPVRLVPVVELTLKAGAFFPNYSMRLETNSFLWGKVNRFNKTTYQGLKELTLEGLREDMRDNAGPWMADWQLHQILSIRDGLVRAIEANPSFF